ncbi:MAG: aldo/keto reductase [Prevotella sp.]|nr:aldo/keto reductase [Prevotella sp.]
MDDLTPQCVESNPSHRPQLISRRSFLRQLGVSTGSAMAMMALDPFSAFANKTIVSSSQLPNQMTYRTQRGSGEQISLLGFGMMRLPNNQDEVNALVDYAIEHGVNYFDTAPMYMGGQSEVLTGNALARYPRDKYYIATKMSNQNRRLWSFEDSKRLYETSLEHLRVDYIDYYLLHSIGGGMDSLKGRFLDNGILDFLLREREAGRIRHLGFSYHGDVRDFDWLLDRQMEYQWDFCQIQMNFLDWRHASLRGGRRSDADAEYLYGKCLKAGVQCVVMEPLRGGAFGRMAQELTDQLRAMHPDDSTARWAFRWVGSYPNILTTLSGMNRMEHLVENVETFSPLLPCSEQENQLLASIADQMSGIPTIPCTTCEYCMPCPYGVNIPANFACYNEAVNNHILPLPDPTAENYQERKQQFIESFREALPDEATWAKKCQDCELCLSKCPQQIRIPNQLARIVEVMRPART